jgi:hypothetical protein
MKSEKATKLFAIILSILMISIIGGCSDDDKDNKVVTPVETTANIEGTLFLPAVQIGNTFVVLVDTDTNGGNGEIKSVTGTCGNSTSVSYQIDSIPSGTYYLYAAVYVVSSSGEPTTGDYLGYYDTGLTEPPAPNAVVPDSGTVTYNISLTEL